MAAHCSILAWRIPWTEESGEFPSMGSQSLTRLNRLNVHTQRNTVKQLYSNKQSFKK